ncbi:MAG: MtrB/PioB family decaheme-associated outer membrane protein [Betaproteobacteria bacterium]|nr:MtrB/PioB family decaheme-associated outer membrane protein [Betaproteobacteria bacterium]
MTMNKNRNDIGSRQKILVLALLAVFGPAHAEDDTVAALINPDTAMASAGLGWASGDRWDRSLFGQYNGLSVNGANLLLDFLYTRRDDNGVWTTAAGRNLGLDVLDVGFAQEKQGDWRYAVDYSQMVRRDPHTINTGLQGMGSTTPVIGNALAAPGAGSESRLSQKRKGFTLAASKSLMPGLSLDASYRYEDKEGSRLSGIGGYCSNVISPICVAAPGTIAALYLAPEPIKSTTQQFEAKINYSGAKFSLAAGYYGGLYSNGNALLAPAFANGASTITNTGDTLGLLAANLAQASALPPDNLSHQIYVSGNAALPLNTRMNFKAAYTKATQDTDYPGQLLAGAAAGRANLGGELDTTLLQAGFSSRPLPKVSLNGSVRWEDRQDKTERGIYVVAPNGTLYTNNPASSETGNAKFEAGYQVTGADRATLGVDYGYVNRDQPVGTTWIPANSMAAMRASNNETGLYGEWRRSMSETLNGALTYRYAKREGYHWYSLDQATGFNFVRYDSFNSSSGTFPSTMLDRDRQTLKLSGDWSPTKELSLNFSLEDGKDSYNGPTNAGLNDTKVQLYNVDAAWKLSDKWKMTGYASFGKQNLNMRQGIGYIADMEQRDFAAGLGFVGTLKAGMEVGGELSYLEDKSDYNISMTTAATVPNLPGNTYRATLLKLYAKVALDKKSDLRVDLIQQWARYDDWTWGYAGVPFTYSDNSTVMMQPTQNVTFVGVRYIYKFR